MVQDEQGQDRGAALAAFFVLFNEIGILAQLSAAMFEARMPAGYLTSQFALLNHLIRVRDGRTPLELARAFQVPKTTMTHTIALLEKRGHIAVRPNPEDGRSKQVWLTDAGRAFREQALRAMAPDMMELAKAFAPERAAALLPDLTELRKLLDARRDG
jgi:DNA-binding MarR family transcriptional regulator